MPGPKVQEWLDAEWSKDEIADEAALQAALATALAADAAADASVLAAKDAEIASLQAQLADCQDNTPPPPPGDTTAPTTPTGLAASGITASQINLTWNASTDAVGVVGYNVFRNGVEVGNPVGLSFLSTGLAASTAYAFTVRARDAAGNMSGASAILNATTLAATTPPPSTVHPKNSSTGAKGTRTSYTGPSTINTAGTLIENKNISGQIVVNTSGVKFKNCSFTNFAWYAILAENNIVTVEDCTFNGLGSVDTKAFGGKGGTWLRNNISGMVIAIDFWGGPGLIEDNYIHDLATASNDPNKRHFDGIAFLGGAGVTIRHNTIEVSDGTACTFLSAQNGHIDNVLVENNLLLGQASYTCYAEASSGGMSNVRYINNIIERGLFGYILNDSGSLDQGNIKWRLGTDPNPAAYTAWLAAT